VTGMLIRLSIDAVALIVLIGCLGTANAKGLAEEIGGCKPGEAVKLTSVELFQNEYEGVVDTYEESWRESITFHGVKSWVGAEDGYTAYKCVKDDDECTSSFGCPTPHDGEGGWMFTYGSHTYGMEDKNCFGVLFRYPSGQWRGFTVASEDGPLGRHNGGQPQNDDWGDVEVEVKCIPTTPGPTAPPVTPTPPPKEDTSWDDPQSPLNVALSEWQEADSGGGSGGIIIGVLVVLLLLSVVGFCGFWFSKEKAKNRNLSISEFKFIVIARMSGAAAAAVPTEQQQQQQQQTGDTAAVPKAEGNTAAGQM